MRLKKLYIDNYKHLHDVLIEFDNQDEEFGSALLRFFIGSNGAGKSAVIEAIALIFTRILQDEAPGFGFELEYSLKVNEHDVNVKVSSKVDENHNNIPINKIGWIKPRFTVIIKIDNDIEEYLDFDKKKFSEYREYHPSRIISYSSGPNNIMDNVLRLSPAASLKSDIYDVGYGAISSIEKNRRENEIEQCVDKLKKLIDNPNYIFIDNETAKLVLIALCSVLPGKTKVNELTVIQRNYCELRKKLLNYISKDFLPISFSLVANNVLLGEIINSKERLSSPQILFLELMYNEKEAKERGVKCLNERSIIRNVNNSQQEAIAIFNLESGPNIDEGLFYSPKLDERGDPMQFLMTLVTAKREGILKDAHIALRYGDCEDLILESSLSDGEYLWIGRVGLILLSLFSDKSNNIFLFDEPDVHLNESWIIEFVSLLQEITCKSGRKFADEFIIATHSSLILSDATPNQVYHFRSVNGNITVEPGIISTFAADRDEITRRIFKLEKMEKKYSKKLVNEVINSGTEEDVRKLIEITGPGYDRFRLRDKLSDMDN